jgi:3-hydroxyisobutyrate dehydrogenase
MQQRDFTPPRSYARQLAKDLKAVKDFADGLGLELPVVAAAVARYQAFVEQGGALQESAAIARLYEPKP